MVISAIYRGPKYVLLQYQRRVYSKQLIVRNYKYYTSLLYGLLLKRIVLSLNVSLGVRVDSRRGY